MSVTRKIAVIGADSYIGREFSRYVVTRLKLAAPAQYGKLYDIRRTPALIDSLMNYKPTTIIVFAAKSKVEESFTSPQDWFDVNVTAKVRLVEELKRCPWLERFVEFSTPEVYGSSDQAVKERVQFNPSTPYAASRAAFDSYLTMQREHFNFPAVITRTANVYGPGQQSYRLIPHVIQQKKNHATVQLHGGGKTMRAWIHIEDVCNALNRVITEKPQDWHISGDEHLSVADVVKKIGADSKSIKERIAKDQRYWLDDSKLKNLGWKQLTKLDDYLKIPGVL